jgi:hypothetical protein
LAGFEPRAAALAVVEKLASISRHGLGGLMSAFWAGEDGDPLHQRCALIISSTRSQPNSSRRRRLAFCELYQEHLMARQSKAGKFS